MTTGEGPAPPWLNDAIGADVRAARRLRWGFSHESWAFEAGGRALVATRIDDVTAARAIVARGPELARRLATAGVPSPTPDAAVSRPELGIVVAAYIEGRPAIEVMGDEAGARFVGELAGDAWARLGVVDTSALGLDYLWARPGDLRAEAAAWLRAVEPDLADRELVILRERVAAIESLLAGRPPGMVHGDLVPVNLLVRDDRLAALLDLEGVHVGEPLLDAAWFSWIVRYHHPALADAASGGFANAAGIDSADARTAALLAALPSLRILELLGRRPIQTAARGHWLRQLRASVAA